jgi:hypothetical protein
MFGLALAGCQYADDRSSPRAEASGQRVEAGDLSLATSLVVSQPLATGSRPADSRLFERLDATETGIDLVHRFPADASFDMLSDQYSGSGVCIGDVDGDDRPDIYVTNYDQGNRLYKNLGNWRFQDVTEQARVDGAGRWCAGPAFVDIDNDGDLDLYVCVFNAPNLLYLNRGHGTFDERAREFGLDFIGASVMMSFADYDSDGDLDGYLVTHRMKIGDGHRLPSSAQEAQRRGIIRRDDQVGARVNPPYRELFELIDKSEGRKELAIAGQQDYLYRNDQGHFRVVNDEAGIRGCGIGLAATWWDYNDDGRIDLYVSNDYKGADQLYRNRGDGTFVESARAALPHIPWFSMGSDAADINNDGRVDFLASDMSGTSHVSQKISMGDMNKDRWFLIQSDPQQTMRNSLYLNTGGDRLMEAAYLTGLASSDWTWSPKFADLDNDGWIDLFVTNGMSRNFMDSDLISQVKSERSEQWRATPVLRQANLAFRNLGDLEFREMGASWGLDQVSASYGAALSDLDRDGDLDLVVTNFDECVSVFRNNGSAGNRLLVRLLGTKSNRWGIGTKVAMETAAGIQVRQLTLAQGFMSANEPLLHFGLGDTERLSRLIITWPNGHRQTVTDLVANRLYTVTESVDTSPPRPDSSPDAPWFVRSQRFASVRHRETPFDDYQRQPLLPGKLSQMGPGLAVADVDGDGVDDLYLSGAAGQSGQLVLTREPPIVRDEPFRADADAEELGSLFFNADADGDQDLYVVAGGVEGEPGSVSVRDRLYLNDGRGNFANAPEDTIPDDRDSGGTVVAADFDQDADLDLFIGGRVVPGQYPMAASNRLLRNEGGRFLDVTDSAATSLRSTGMVTGALWSDADGDGWVDLLLTHEWGPVRLFRNQSGTLVDVTELAGHLQYTGWWNGITGRDLDGDGDIDYIATNVGLNTKYRASVDRPVRLYYGDFEGRGEKQIVEACYEHDTLYPVRGRSCSTAVMPSLNSRFTTYKDFALATLSDVYTDDRLRNAVRFAANTLESGVFLNDGRGQFTFQPLPRLAQIASGYGVIATEINGDEHADIFIVQNSFSPQPETGKFDGGLSLLLVGDGDGTFTPVWPRTSGLIIPGDAKSLVLANLRGAGHMDIVVGINDEQLLTFARRSPANSFLHIALQGPTGNPTGVGARLTVRQSDGSSQTAEVYAGSGYLSQSTRWVTFGRRSTDEPVAVQVRWPNGRTSEHTIDARSSSAILQ